MRGNCLSYWRRRSGWREEIEGRDSLRSPSSERQVFKSLVLGAGTSPNAYHYDTFEVHRLRSYWLSCQILPIQGCCSDEMRIRRSFTLISQSTLVVSYAFDCLWSDYNFNPLHSPFSRVLWTTPSPDMDRFGCMCDIIWGRPKKHILESTLMSCP